jgi:hypothetical protein
VLQNQPDVFMRTKKPGIKPSKNLRADYRNQRTFDLSFPANDLLCCAHERGAVSALTRWASPWRWLLMLGRVEFAKD